MRYLLIILLFAVGGSLSFAQQTYIDDLNGLSYSYPDGWNKDQNSTGNYFVTNDTAYFLAQVDWYLEKFTFSAANINDSAYRKDLHDKMTFSTGREVILVEYGNMTVSGMPAYFLLWSVPGKGNNASTGTKIIQVQTGDAEKLFTFNAGAPVSFFNGYKYIFDSIIASIKIK